MLRIFTLVSSAGFEPANLGARGVLVQGLTVRTEYNDVTPSPFPLTGVSNYIRTEYKSVLLPCRPAFRCLLRLISTYFTDRSGVVRYKNRTTLCTYSE